MSLFTSAFNSSTAAGPSFTPPSKGQSGQKKRKRPSAGGNDESSHADKNGQLRSTQANLQKLMKRVDGFSAPSKSGGENMGSIKKNKKKGKKEEHRSDPVEMISPAKSSPASFKGKKAKSDKSEAVAPATSRVHSSGDKASKSQKGQIEPAELPLPHNIKTSESSESEGLTKMQRDMKAKLEGARFR